MKTVAANGLKFAYLEEGAGPLVLLLHGFPDTPYTWDGVMSPLARAGYRAVAPYLRGYYPTEIPKDGRYDSDTLGRDVLALIEALGEESAIVIAHDWGTAGAFTAAAMDPKRIRFLVTVAIPHAGAVLPYPRIIWGARHFLTFQSKRTEAWIRENDLAGIDTLVRRWSPTWNFPPSETARVKESFRHPGSLEAALGYYRALTLPSKSMRAPVQMPSAAFYGSQDPALRRSDFERSRRHYKQSYEIIETRGGHFIQREDPDRFREELLRVCGSFERETRDT
jgi:pimeloyl-ACP methyl ester carboxylesterase